MRAVTVMYDSLNRRFLPPYGAEGIIAPNFRRLAEHSITFDNFYCGSMPCMPARRELQRHGIRCDGHAAHQITRTELDSYDKIYYMDASKQTSHRSFLQRNSQQRAILFSSASAPPTSKQS